jgi:hypothetical protein
MARKSLVVVNADQATFECTFGRGCEGLCCKNGRPSVTEAEAKIIEASLDRFLPHLRPEAQKLLQKQGWLGRRLKVGLPMLRVVKEWCVFFHEGCVLHKVGLEEGDFSKYKPIQCSLFPLEPNGDGTWYVRQWGVEDEGWDLLCLNPENSRKKAVETLAPEIAVAEALPEDYTWGDDPGRNNGQKISRRSTRK